MATKRMAVATGITAYAAYIKAGGTLSEPEWIEQQVLSGVNAERAKTYAETAEAAAARTGDDLDDIRQEHETALQEIESAKSQAVATVGDTGAEAVREIGQEKTNAINAVNTAQTDATGAVRDAAASATQSLERKETGIINDLDAEKQTILQDLASAKASALSDIGTAGQTGVTAISDEKDADIAAYREAAEEIRATLPADYIEITERVDELEKAASESTGKIYIYGASGWNNDNPALTRLYDAVGMAANAGTDATNPAECVNDFDRVPMFARRKCVGHWEAAASGDRARFVVQAYDGDPDYAEDGSMGDYVAVECRPAYVYDDGDIRAVSGVKLPGYRPFACLETERGSGVCRPYTYLPVYALALKDGKAVSLPGLANRQGTYANLLADAKTYANADVRTFAILEPADVNYYEETLFGIEFATHIEQNVIQGACNLRHTAGDRATVYDATHFLCTPYHAGRAVGSYVSINDASQSDIQVTNYPSHKIIGSIRCDAGGSESASGTYQLIEVEALDDKTYESGIEYMIVSRAFYTGSTEAVKVPTGSPVSNTDGYHPMKYRHRENVYGNQWCTTMDLFNVRVPVEGEADQYTLDWYYMPDPTKWQSGNPTDSTMKTNNAFVKLGYSTPKELYRSGYQTGQAVVEEYPDLRIPEVATGGSAAKFNGASAYLVHTSVSRSVRRGGTEYYGASDGFGAVFGTLTPSYGHAYFGGGLFFRQ